jgi:hypothetical protein
MTPDDLAQISVILKAHISPLLPPGSDAVVVIVTGHRLEVGECGEVEISVTSTVDDKQADYILRMAAGCDEEGEEWKR